MGREKHRRKLKLFLLLYLIMFASVLSMVTLSKFTGSASGGGTMQVAKWDVTLNTSDNSSDTINLISGNNEISYTVKVKSLSDVKVGYSIKISGIPSGVKVKLDTGSYQTPSSGVVTFNSVGYINANASTNQVSHILTFTAPIGSSAVSSKSIDIDVIFVQLQ